MPQRVQFASFTIDTVTRTPITVPAACHSVTLRNGDLVNDATMFDAAAGGNSKTLSAGAEQTIAGPPSLFNASDIVVWVRAVAGTGPIVAEYRV